jgi:hypothetical protein
MIKYICDACGKEEDAVFIKSGRSLYKPYDWFVRSDEDGEQHACSRECIAIVAKNTGKSDLVLPI